MKKVRISQRVIFYKYAQIEISVPDTIQEIDLHEYLLQNEDIHFCLENNLIKSNYYFGFGLDKYGMCEKDWEVETRYDLLDENDDPTCGGHL